MIKTYKLRGGHLEGGDGAASIDAATIWIDLNAPTAEEDADVERAIGLSIPTRAEMREIEASNRFYVEGGAHFMTAFVIHSIELAVPMGSAITFILTDKQLVTVRYAEPKAFPTFLAKVEKGEKACGSPTDILIGLIEGLVQRQADLIERIQDVVDRMAPSIFEIKGGQQTRTKRLDVVLRTIGKEGDIIARAQESAFSIDRLLTFLSQALRERGVDGRLTKQVKTVQRDIASLLDHMRFLSARIEFLLDATLGMISNEQNQIIKLFSVAAVIFLPPTLVASIYGMNFKRMPELDWYWGYPMALVLMVLAAVLPYVFFRRKGWL